MNLPAELHIIGLVLVVMGVAYCAIYPRMQVKTIRRMMLIDLLLIGALLGIAATVYAGTGTRFSLIFFTTNWWVFTLIAAMVIETPFFIWFCRKWGIDLGGRDD
jgi:hypothetical protein